MGWTDTFGLMINELLFPTPICTITEIEKRNFTVYVTYVENGVEDVFWFGIDELGMVEGKDFNEKVSNVMKLYNFNVDAGKVNREG